VAATPVQLLIPLRFVEEHDEKMYARHGELGEQARNVIRQLERYFDQGERTVREGVSVQLLRRLDLDPRAKTRPRSPPDMEIRRAAGCGKAPGTTRLDS
jgi:predicted ribonuclease YlaK